VGGGGPVVMGLRWWLDVVVRRGNGGVVVVRWCGEDGAGLFIAGARSVRGDFCAHRCSGEVEAAGRNPGCR
jgi:hypothetical protein